MTIEKAWFVLEHGSAKGLQVYLEAIDTIKENCVEIVRCRDCKHFHSEVKDEFTTFFGCDEKHHPWGENWFCADGKRRDDDG